MNIIIPMAGMGKRMRPHTLTTPKPLIKLAEKPIVEHLIDEIMLSCEEKIDEIAFVIGRFGKEVEEQLIDCVRKKGATAKIYYQDEALGTAHAIYCAKESMKGNIIVAFADTIFFTDIKIDKNKDALIWTKKVEHPEAFGVVIYGEDGRISSFAEKPKTFVSDMAIIGVYYFKDGENLASELKYLLDNDIKTHGEFQLTDAMENMKNKGLAFYIQNVNQWLDCGNKDATVDTHSKVLIHKNINYISTSAQIENSTIIPPVHIADGVKITNSVVGPCVSVGKNSKIESSNIRHSILQDMVEVKDACVSQSMFGSNSKLESKAKILNLGDYSIA